MISPAFWLTSGNEFKITRSDGSQHIALLQTTGDCLGGLTVRSKITSYGNFRNGGRWEVDRCLGNCTVQYGGQYETTKGFINAKCNGTILSADKIGFWCESGSASDGSVIMIGGAGGDCGKAYSGIGITVAHVTSFNSAGRNEKDIADTPHTCHFSKHYSLNLWIR